MFELFLICFVLYIFIQIFRKVIDFKNQSSNNNEQRTEVEESPEKDVFQQKVKVKSATEIDRKKDKAPNSIIKGRRPSPNKSITKINNTLNVMNYRNDDHKYGLVVYDRGFQPDGEWCWLYYVYGKRLVCRSSQSMSKLYPVSNGEYLTFAKAQYEAWIDINEKQILDKMDSEPKEETGPPPKCKCAVCKGDSIVFWSTGSAAAWQGSSDRQNFRDVCDECKGAGFVENIL